jgi:serine/threonine protein kinase
MAESPSTIRVGDQEFTLGEDIFRPRTNRLVSRGTFVRKARLSSDKDGTWPLCIKCSWRSQDRADEKEALLALQNIPGIVKMVAGQDGVDITQCRRNMPMEKLIPKVPKRRLEASDYEFRSKKPRVDKPPIKRLHSPNKSHPLGESLAKPSIPFYNRIQQVIVMEAAGRPYDHRNHSPLQKMRCLREILKTLWAMRKEGWVHCDISPANIMIPFKGATGPAGIIIDLDMSWKVSDDDAGGKELVGTVCFMATDILENFALPTHHVLHDMESVFWVAFIDGLYRSGMVGGVSWLERLDQNSQDKDAVRTYKREALQDVLIDDIKGFQDYFLEQYSVMRQLLRDWTRRLLRQDRSRTLSLVDGLQMYNVHQIRYTDRHDPEKVFGDVDKLFGKFIAIEERIASK